MTAKSDSHESPQSASDETSGDALLDGQRVKKKARIAWRRTVAGGAALAAIVLIINISVLIWTLTAFSWSDSGLVTVYTGSCAVAKRTTIWVDLVINTLSTLLLGASNSCAQLLSAPTRADINKSHARGKWMDIGVPSVRNLRYIPWWRHVLWAVLFASSVPLHFFYNSVIFNTLSADEYQAALVTHDFLAGGWWNETRVSATLLAFGADENVWGMAYLRLPQSEALRRVQSETAVFLRRLHHMQDHPEALQRLENSQCLQALGNSRFESRWHNVLLVSNVTQPDNVVEVWVHWPGSFDDEYWVCNGEDGSQHLEADDKCDVKSLLSNPSSWTIPNVQYCMGVDSYEELRNCTLLSAKVDYCLAEVQSPRCTVRISTLLLGIVIACNVLKTICLAVTAFCRNFEPMATIGDGIASFLDQPDNRTKGIGPVSYKDARTQPASLYGATTSKEFKRRNRRWFQAVSTKRWLLCILVCVIVWTAALVLFLLAATVGNVNSNGVNSTKFSTIWAQGVGNFNPSAVISDTKNGNLIMPNVLQANAPQVAISLTYLFYNNVLTYMVLAREWSQFGRIRKGLRVSRPAKRSAQRSTYWLQLPYRYILPVMVLMVILHWLIARSIFFVQMPVYDIQGKQVPRARMHGCAYSPLAIFFALIVGGILIISLVGCSLFKLNPGVPIVGSCSLAISAAAHAGADEKDVVLKPLMYGVVIPEAGATAGKTKEKAKVGLSSREVHPLIDGGWYS